MIGEKIKELRRSLGMTQAELAGDTVTRNQISQIENGVASPSLATVTELAARLHVPMAYLLAEDGSLADYRKLGAMEKIKKLYRQGDYRRCLSALFDLAVSDDETELLMARASLMLGMERYRSGSLSAASSLFSNAKTHAKCSIYAEKALFGISDAYLSAISAIRGDGNPSLRRLDDIFGENEDAAAELSYIRALFCEGQAFPYAQKRPLYARHLEARRRIKMQELSSAEGLLDEILADTDASQDAIVRYFALGDLELCCKETENYKKAYECSAEKLVMLDKMNR